MTILAIEDAIIARIRAVLLGKVRHVESIPADWDDDTLKRVLRLAPGVFVSFGGGTPPGGRSGTAAQISARWGVFVVTGHASGEAVRRRGDTNQAGAYELVEALAAKLHGFNIPNEGTLDLVAVENLYSGQIDNQGIAVYSLVFQMPMAWSGDLDLTTLASFETFYAQHDIPTFETEAERRKWLENPANYSTSRPDAQDQVNVPQ